jgi:hypothetical protein
MSLEYHITTDAFTLFGGGISKTINKDNPDYQILVDFYRAGNKKALENYLLALKKVVETPSYKDCGFTIIEDRVQVNGKFLPASLGRKIRQLADAGASPERFLNMWKKLDKNPSYQAVQSFYDFDERNHLPITEDGNVVGLKVVRGDFTDNYSGKFDNTPGQTPSIPRNECDDNTNVACSKGFHIGGFEYVLSYADNYCSNGKKYIQVEFSPEDVISVPSDSRENKIRVCKYSVIKEITREEVVAWKNQAYNVKPVSEDGRCTDCDEELKNCYCDDDSSEDEYDDEDENEFDDECYICGSQYCSGYCEDEEY